MTGQSGDSRDRDAADPADQSIRNGLQPGSSRGDTWGDAVREQEDGAPSYRAASGDAPDYREGRQPSPPADFHQSQDYRDYIESRLPRPAQGQRGRSNRGQGEPGQGERGQQARGQQARGS